MTEKPNACCNVAENLRELSKHQDPDMTILRCEECGRRHFELSVDPGEIFARGQEIA